MLAVLFGSSQTAEDCKTQYEFFTHNQTGKDSIAAVLRGLLRSGLVRYASTGKNEVHPMEMATKMYVLTEQGRAELEGYSKILTTCMVKKDEA